MAAAAKRTICNIESSTGRMDDMAWSDPPPISEIFCPSILFHSSRSTHFFRLGYFQITKLVTYILSFSLTYDSLIPLVTRCSLDSARPNTE